MKRLATWMLLCLPLLTMPAAMGQDSGGGSPPGDRFGPPRGFRGGGPGGLGGGLGGDRLDGMQRPTAEEAQRVAELTRQHMPNMASLIETLPESTARRRLRFNAFRKMRDLQRIDRDTDPAAFEQRLERLRREDDLFGLLIQFRDAEPEQRASLRGDLRERFAAMLSEHLNERQSRLDALRDSLEREQQRLDQDRANVSRLLEMRVESFLRETLSAPDPDAPATQPFDGREP